MFACDIDLSGFRTLVGRTLDVLEQKLDQAVEHAAVEGAEAARHSTAFKDRSTVLRSSITAHFLRSRGRSVTWEILSPAPYSRFVEEGTRPHDIRPKAAYNLNGPLRSGQTRRASGKGPHEHIVGRGQALRFLVGGQWVFASVVHHPGTAPHPFLGIGYLQAERTLWRECEKIPIALARVWQ